MIDYCQGDELPPWEGVYRGNGVPPDLSTGWTFTVTVAHPDETTLTLTTGIVGAVGGAFTVNWPKGFLDIAVKIWGIQMTARRFDGDEFTVKDTMKITTRILAET